LCSWWFQQFTLKRKNTPVAPVDPTLGGALALCVIFDWLTLGGTLVWFWGPFIMMNESSFPFAAMGATQRK
jgi:hypothetical protein